MKTHDKPEFYYDNRRLMKNMTNHLYFIGTYVSHMAKYDVFLCVGTNISSSEFLQPLSCGHFLQPKCSISL